MFRCPRAFVSSLTTTGDCLSLRVEQRSGCSSVPPPDSPGLAAGLDFVSCNTPILRVSEAHESNLLCGGIRVLDSCVNFSLK